jgi:hypothetical protein
MDDQTFTDLLFGGLGTDNATALLVAARAGIRRLLFAGY